MSTYVSLINWTEQGIKNFRDTTHRADDFTNAVEKAGGHVREILWCVGEYDLITIVDFPDDESATASLLQVGALGNIRTRTMRGFDAQQMGRIIDKASS
jgi:uncharacterized protein with GYD domain